MVQKLFGLGLGATGTAAILIVGGILVNEFASAELGKFAIFGGIAGYKKMIKEVEERLYSTNGATKKS